MTKNSLKNGPNKVGIALQWAIYIFLYRFYHFYRLFPYKMINLSTYIDDFYCIDRLLFIVLELDTANGLISTKRFGKMSVFGL